jgi:D-3-phosphoglycerate dehydrogenase
MAQVACLSPFSEEAVRDLFKGRHEVEIAIAPDPPAQEAIRDLVADADLVIGDRRHKHRIDRPVLKAMRKARLIQQPAVGFDVIDHRAAAELGIPVANAAGYNRESVADWVLMAILNLLRLGSFGDRRMHEGQWPYSKMMGRELGSMTVGILGLGNVGNAVATRLRGFGAQILFTDVVGRSIAGAQQVGLGELLDAANIVTIHVPLDKESRHLIDATALGRMQPGAILVNAARGALVDQDALVQALRSGRLAGAALDVYEEEPLAVESPLRSFDNVFMSPHVGGFTQEAERRVMEVCGDNMLRVLDGSDPLNIVNGVSRRR